MARSWITDLWVKDAVATLPDGTTTKIMATREQKRAMKSLPEHFRSSRWMKGKRWRVGWYEDSVNGAEQRTRGFDSKQEAEAFAAELEDDIRTGRYLDPAARNRSFGEIAEEWLTSKKQVKEATALRYRQALDYHVLPKWTRTPIGSITRSGIDTWVSELLAGEAPNGFQRKKNSTPLSPASVRHIVRVHFGSVMRYAIDTRQISINPLVGVELPRDAHTEIEELRVLTHAGVDALADAAAEASRRRADRALIHLLAYCGPRINEALALQVGDLDLEHRRAMIRRTWTRALDGTWKIGPPKTWAKRAIPLPEFLISELRELMTDQHAKAYLFRERRGSAAAIEYKNWYNNVWTKATTAAGAPDGLTIHDLRHTAASLAIAAGADVMVVQRMLGHKDATETLNTYAHLWPDRLDEVMDAISNHRKEADAKAAKASAATVPC